VVTRERGVHRDVEYETLPAVNSRPEQELSVATLVCLECGEESDEARGWRAFVDDDDLLVYCSDCAAREFDC
jgi:hypothetical protein